MAELNNVVVETEDDELTNILYLNNNKNFIKRILNPAEYPVMPWGNGIATHQMSDAEIDGRFIVYPNIVQRTNGDLELLEDDYAIDYAINKGEYLEFPSQEKASWFAKNYKKFWSK